MADSEPTVGFILKPSKVKQRREIQSLLGHHQTIMMIILMWKIIKSKIMHVINLARKINVFRNRALLNGYPCCRSYHCPSTVIQYESYCILVLEVCKPYTRNIIVIKSWKSIWLEILSTIPNFTPPTNEIVISGNNLISAMRI